MSFSDNTDNPKISVIIPVYNVKPYLAQSLNSVINQTYKNLEIIIVDDGSDDGSGEMCDEYARKDDRIKVIHRENGGLSAARNTGLDNMSGEYVAFLDSDDVYLPEAMEKSLDAILTKNVDCVGYKYLIYMNDIVYEDMPKKKVVPSISEGLYSRKDALIAMTEQRLDVSVYTKFTKRELWDNLRFPEGHVYEDLYIMPSLFGRIEKFYVIKDVLMLYRKRKQSITMTNSLKNIKDLLDSWTLFINYTQTNTSEFDTCETQKIYKSVFTNLILRYAWLLPLNFPDKTEVLRLMKEYIHNLESKIKIKDFSPEIRLTYYMIFNYPWFVSVFYAPCRYLYKIIKRIAGNRAK